MGEAEVVDQGAVDNDAFVAPRADGVFGHEGPAALAGAVFEKGLEGGAHGCFVGDAELGELVEGGVVGFDWLVGWFEVQSGHFDWSGVSYGRVGFIHNTILAGIESMPRAGTEGSWVWVFFRIRAI